MGGILRARPSRCVLTNMINASPYLNRSSVSDFFVGSERGEATEQPGNLAAPQQNFKAKNINLQGSGLVSVAPTPRRREATRGERRTEGGREGGNTHNTHRQTQTHSQTQGASGQVWERL